MFGIKDRCFKIWYTHGIPDEWKKEVSMARKKKILTIAGVLILIAVIGTGVYFGTRKTETSNTELAYVYRVSLMNPASQVQRMAGTVEPQETWEVQKSSDREVEQILVKAGDEVKVGTALFVYNTEQTQTELEEAQLEIERFDGEMENLKTQIAQLEKEKKKAAEDEKFSYTTQIQTAQTDLKKSEYEKKAKQVEISQKQDKIANATVVSEIDGIVKRINDGSETDMYSSDSNAFITILATGDYRIKGKVNEQNLSEIQEGEKAIVRSRVDENQTWSGTFTAVNKDEAENNNNKYYGATSTETTSSSYSFYVMLDSSDGLLLGQHVYIEKDLGEEQSGIWLDEGYIVNADSKPYVWTEDNKGKLEKRDVTLGEYNEETYQYEIQSGLEESDYIAFTQDFLEEGMKATHEESETISDEESTDDTGKMEEPEKISETESEE